MKIQNYHTRKIACMAFVIGVLCLPVGGFAQSDEIPRMANGKPDMQGTWDFRTITPFQRPEALGEKEYLSAEEFAEFEEADGVRRRSCWSFEEPCSFVGAEGRR